MRLIYPRQQPLQALQLLSDDQDPTGEMLDDLYSLLDGMEWSSERDGAISLVLSYGDVIVNPGDWLVRLTNHHLIILTDAAFHCTFQEG